ncbi:GNAT family N-acetyltransferase [uncultured Kordia sp.]|uniref:GNAT family N-acetyltransferase n=1 Tax=uncultured Kordia sp. TaxID=507699 RepID=UPI00260C84D1|nr:GNAT family N-acetyltransferase [uncultured Kordia sp.]
MNIEKKLDNPVWNSLQETHKNHAVTYDEVAFYHPSYCPFGGFIKSHDVMNSMNAYSQLVDSFYIVGEKPLFSNELTLHNNLICHQMVLKKTIDVAINEEIVELTTEAQKAALFDLVNLVQPGYFNDKTADLGSYFGIYKAGKLVAVTGERMKMNEFTEVSAVVTHPEHTGKGYAKQLIKQTTTHIFNQNKTPYLHVAASNIGAIKLYEKLGFTTRRKISFWHFKTR